MSRQREALKFTPSEAGFVIGRPARVVNKAVDGGIIDAQTSRTGSIIIRVLGRAELRFLKLSDVFAKDFTPSGRRRIYTALKSAPAGTEELKLGAMRLDLVSLDYDLEPRLARLDALKAAVEGHGTAEPMICGTGIPVYVIAGLARGEDRDEIKADYPSLTPKQIDIAIDYGIAYPKKGRPYPARSFKRSLADLCLHELPIARTRSGPRKIGP